MFKPFQKLGEMGIKGSDNSPISESSPENKKAINLEIRKIFEANPSLKEEIIEVMQRMAENGEPLPVMHITAPEIENEEGIRRDSGVISSINKLGFRARHTNVGAFVIREGGVRLALPKDFIANPESFMKSLILWMKRYLHHGYKTNKTIYGEEHGRGKGVPAMLVLRGSVVLERGTDYDDHFILSENVPADFILGRINLGENDQGAIDVGELASRLIDILDQSYSAAKKIA